MSEVKRYRVLLAIDDNPLNSTWTKVVMAADFDRVTAECKALQERLNAADQANDDLSFQLKDREGSRRDWFDEAKRLEKMAEELRAEVTRLDLMGAESDYKYDQRYAQFERVLAERDAQLSACIAALREAGDYRSVASIEAALSASAEPSAPKCCKCNDTGEAVIKGAQPWDKRLSIQCDCAIEGLRAPVKRDERAEFERAFVVQDGVFFWAERNEYRSMNGRSIEYTDATDLNLRLQGWQARAALDKAYIPDGYAVVPIKPNKAMLDACRVAGKLSVWGDMMAAALDKSTEGASHE